MSELRAMVGAGRLGYLNVVSAAGVGPANTEV